MWRLLVTFSGGWRWWHWQPARHITWDFSAAWRALSLTREDITSLELACNEETFDCLCLLMSWEPTLFVEPRTAVLGARDVDCLFTYSRRSVCHLVISHETCRLNCTWNFIDLQHRCKNVQIKIKYVKIH